MVTGEEPLAEEWERRALLCLLLSAEDREFPERRGER